MTTEELRISRNRAYVEYLHATDITDKAEKLRRWKALCLAYNDTMKQDKQWYEQLPKTTMD